MKSHLILNDGYLSAKRVCLNIGTLTIAALLLAGCSTLKPTQKALAPEDYRKRHPIVLQDSVEHMDIFALGGRIDQRQSLDVISFGKDYVENGTGNITAALPNTITAQAQPQIIHALQQALAEAGTTQQMEITRYDANPKIGTSPIRLSFVKLKAKLEGECGQWPADIAGGKDLESWQNRPYHNLGCSQQSMFAAQVANPRDLIRPRGESAPDVVQRTKAIQSLRLGSSTAR